jgi:hypothetical protein
LVFALAVGNPFEADDAHLNRCRHHCQIRNRLLELTVRGIKSLRADIRGFAMQGIHAMSGRRPVTVLGWRGSWD